jgi:hypothetical protein
MIWKKTLNSLIVFALLVGLYVADRWWTEQRRTAKSLSERAFSVKKEDVTEMTLVTPKEIITVKKESLTTGSLAAEDKGKEIEKGKEAPAANWVMTQPIKAPADKDAIEVILGNLVPALRYGEFTVDETIKIEDYGLNAPTYKLMLKTKDGKTLTLLVGKQAAESGKFYAKIESENKIFSISEYIKDKLDKKPFDLRDRTVLPIAVDDARRVVLSRTIKTPLEVKTTDEGATRTTTGFQTKPTEKIVLAKTGNDWRIEEPVAWKGDSLEVENLLRKLKTEKVAAFLDTPTTGVTFGFDKPQLDLQIEQITKAGDRGTTGATTQTQTLILLVGDRETSPGKDFYARRGDGTMVTIGQPLFDALTIKATKLRDKQLFTLASADVAHFEIEAGKSKVRLDKNDRGKWVFADDAATSVDQQIIGDKVSALVNLRAKDFETDQPGDLAQYKLDKPFVRVSVADKAHETTESLLMGDLATRDNESVVFARVRGGKSVVLLDFKQPSEFALTKDKLVDKSLFAFDTHVVARMEVKKSGTTITLVQEGDAWKAQGAKDKEPRRVSTFWAEDIVRGVREMKYADLYKGKLTEKEMGLTSPTLQVILLDKQNAEVARVVRGVVKGERYYTKIRADGPIYGVEQASFRTIESAMDSLLKE